MGDPQKIDVLNHGFARLVSYMQPVPKVVDGPYKDTFQIIHDTEWTGDLEIVRNARVSFDADWRSGDDEGKDKRLIQRMMREHHTTPFEAMVFTFEVQVPIFVTRQWHRHRTWSYNELSARYAALPDVFYLPEPGTIGTQSTSDKQERDITEDDVLQVMEHNKQLERLKRAYEFDYRLYEDLLEKGWARELARLKLPVGIYTRFFATVDLHNLFHFLRLRLDSHAQYEIRVYAQAMLNLIEPIVPVSAKAFRKRLGEDQAVSRLRAACRKYKANFLETIEFAIMEISP